MPNSIMRRPFIVITIFLSWEDFDDELVVGAFGFGTGFFYAVGGSKYYTHAAVSLYLRFAKDTYLYSGFVKNLFEVAHLYLVGVTLHHNGS